MKFRFLSLLIYPCLLWLIIAGPSEGMCSCKGDAIIVYVNEPFQN